MLRDAPGAAGADSELFKLSDLTRPASVFSAVSRTRADARGKCSTLTRSIGGSADFQLDPMQMMHEPLDHYLNGSL